MIWGAILLGIFGLAGLRGREFKIIGQRKVRGEMARVLGVILLVGAAASACGELLAVVDQDAANLTGLICTGSFLIVLVIGLLTATTDHDLTESGLPPAPMARDDSERES